MFYYGTGNILHDDHRFIECGTGHFMNHLSNGLHTPPFYHNLVLVGNIAPEATTARSGLGIRGPKDNEYFFVSGLKAINYFESPVLRGCFETTCTMRFERATWWNSTQRTWSTPRQSGIFWDLDGTLTGYPNGFVSLDYEYNHFPGLCHHSDEHGNGLVCGAEDGSVRVRRLLVDRQEPWQLDGKDMLVQTSAGSDLVAYDNLKLRGWPVVVVEGEVFDMRVDDPNDFQRLSFQYSMRNYVVEEHGYLYTRALPRSEAIMVHVNFTDWRNHFDATEGLRLDRMPSTEDPFGSHSMMLWPDECAEFNLTEDSAELCGVYVNETGEDLKEEIDEQPEIDMVHGRLTASFSVQAQGRRAGQAYKEARSRAASDERALFKMMTLEQCTELICEMGKSGAGIVTAGVPDPLVDVTSGLLADMMASRKKMGEEEMKLVTRAADWARHVWGKPGHKGAVWIGYVCPSCHKIPDRETSWWVVSGIRKALLLTGP
ncbi:unnamed protein product [Symbiodinium sp. CCMP2592]|nr:unnamed protein product [Symbiodinium sp. CCMP2592]